ncbi:aminoglycoside phosphotransferase family protein [Hymenobacter algoricola]|uniref:Hydroxymethylglutaryl-CoA reductase n=1 Tax=Hymenobacter algoricola TaxID=486267 RepID=A0ABP7MZ86_9BACT
METSPYLSVAFLEPLMRRHAPEHNIRVRAVRPFAVDSSASILATLTAGHSGRPIGHFGLEVDLEVAGQTQTRRLLLKIKPHGREIAGMLAFLAQACGGELAAVYPNYQNLSGFQHTHHRELAVYPLTTAALAPRLWGLHADEEQQVYVVLMEYLENTELLNSVMAPAQWTDAHLRAALTQLAAWHARHLTTTPPAWPDLPSLAYMQQLRPLWSALLSNAATHAPALYPPARVRQLRQAIEAIPATWAALATRPRTLIHNDLNPRNTCFRPGPEGLQFCVYDWELATYHVPQYDVVELLCFVLEADRYHLRPVYLEHYRQALHALTGQYADADAFRADFHRAALDFGLHRLGMYLMAHSVSPYPFLPRVIHSFFNTLDQAEVLAGPAANRALPAVLE